MHISGLIMKTKHLFVCVLLFAKSTGKFDLKAKNFERNVLIQTI